ncbi:pericentrin isoform X3 [Dunckerocampus dactyliophorus]|uniref:pericentrin isoform X3 n=1 Tax=Dunckerocampus dactyliophorus TaxID=161453 RepID=UPI0024068AA0|nr:pericentrin isoform X3 [Dunckerocampus dactyliophorus]
MDEDERRRKVEAGRAKKSSNVPQCQSFASFRQRRAKSNGAGAPKKTAKRKGQAVSQNDCATQDPRIEPTPSLPASGKEPDGNSTHEEVQPKDEHLTTEPLLSFVKLGDEELVALTSNEQLQQLKQAVEKRNEIIAKLSSNLQEARTDRDEVQLKVQSLTGEIQALQKQLQQTSVDFLRLKNQSGAEAPHVVQQQQHHGSHSEDLSVEDLSMEQPGSAGLGSQASVEGLGPDSETETDNVLHELRAKLQEEKENSLRICAELEQERENHQHVLSLLEEQKQGWEEERNKREVLLQELQTQLSKVQHHCTELQQVKEEKEMLNREMLELRSRLEEMEAERREGEEETKFTLRLQSIEDERLRQEEEMRRVKEEYKEELERVGQQLEESVKELQLKEEEVRGLKASKDLQNQTKTACCVEMSSADETSVDTMNVSAPVDLLMERYLSSSFAESSLVHEHVEPCSQLDMSADQSFELNSQLFADQPLLSISNCAPRENSDIYNSSPCLSLADNSNGRWLNDSTSGPMNGVSEQLFNGMAREKELLNQQCGELHQELAMKDHDLNMLRLEVIKMAEELEEARSRWAQVTKELMEALRKLDEEKERRFAEEEMNSKTLEQDSLMNKLGAFLEEKEADISLEASLLAPFAEEDKRTEELKKDQESFPSHQNQQEVRETLLQEITQTAEVISQDDNRLQTLQANYDDLILELEETKRRHQTTATLLDKRTVEMDSTVEDLQITRARLLTVQMEVESLQEDLEKRQSSLQSAEKLRSELEAEIVCLRQNLRSLEDAQHLAVQERERSLRKEEEMGEQVRKMEQVLQEEFEQFETRLQAKDVELAKEREKWEEEMQEKDKELGDVREILEELRMEREEEVKALMDRQVFAVEEATERLRACHQEEMDHLMDEHHKEISELNTRMEAELLEQKAAMEQEQKRQISLIKEVTEREHERTLSELNAQHTEELSRLKTEVSLELRESLEAAHQAELEQAEAQKSLELEALRLSLTNVHMSQLEVSQESAVSKAQAFLRENFTQEMELLQAQHQLDLERIREQNQAQQDSLRELYQRDMGDLKQQFAEEKGSMEEKQTKEIQTLRSDWLIEAESTQSTLQNSLTSTQTELAKTHEAFKETKKALIEAQESLAQTQTELQESKAQLEGFETTNQEQKRNLEEELKQAWADRDAAARSLEELVSSHKALLQEKEQQVRHLEDKERHLQQEVLRLQEEKDLLKKGSEQEVGQLWTQLESMRASRQELGELKEQLLARSSRVDDIERLKAEFNEQKREIKEQNEAELESLRRYFEQRLRVSEESYREEIALLQLRLVEGTLEDSVLKTADSSFACQGPAEEKDGEQCDTSLKLEKHKEVLDSSLHNHLEEKHTLQLSFKEELRQARSDLTDLYYGELQEMKTRHTSEQEQLRAKLSDRHLQEVTRIQLEAARQVEVEVEQRLWCYTEELHTSTTLIHTLYNTVVNMEKQHNAELQKLKQEFEEERSRHKDALMQEKEHAQEEIRSKRDELQEKHEALRINLIRQMEEETACLEKALLEEKDKLNSTPPKLNNSENPQALKAKHDVELQHEKNSMAKEMKELTVLLQQQAEERLKQAQERFEEEKAMLEQCFSQKIEISLAELRNKHQTELEHERVALLSKHSQEMDSLNVRHKAQLDSLGASHRDQLVAMNGELQSKHNAQLVALEASLNSKRKEDLHGLEAMFRETSQAQLEAQEAELARKHQEEKDEIEKRMFANMDTLETTYLKEVQTLRDEMVQLEKRHHQALTSQQVAMMECHVAEQESNREKLRKELTQMHMDKFRAMAAELSQVHQAELSAQKESLDAEHCKALGELKAQVLELEQQHSAALQEIMQTYAAEKEQLSQQHQLQLQELKSISARELEACRRELEEGSSRQRQHFLEEAELLKVQSGDRINQMKADFQQQKEAELEDLRRAFASEHEEKERNYTSKMSQLTAQLQQLDAVVAQLRAEVGCLQGELEGKRAEMDTLDAHLQRRERESQEGGNLLKLLTGDLQSAKEERHKLLQANDKLKKVLMEMLRSTIATEELIGQKLSARSNTSAQSVHQMSSTGYKEAQEPDMTSEDLELSHLLCESLLVSDTQINPGGEEAALIACSRLRHTVDTLLELLNQANTQLEQTHNIHLSLEERFSQGQEDSAQLVEQHKLLLVQFEQEVKLKSQLALELHKAEGLLDGYVAEKEALEEALLQKEAQEERLVEELEDLRRKAHQMEGLGAELHSLRAKHQELSEEHAMLLRQKEHLSAGLGEREKALLTETERLTQDRLDLQRQAEKDHSSLSQRLRALERDLEEQETKGLEIELHHKTHTEDLSQQVQALEKQLKHNRQFIEEQAVEREHERDEFQQEIRRLESQLRQTAGGDVKVHRFEDLVLQVENLQAIIKDKMEDHASSVAANQQAQRELAKRNEEIDKLAGRIRELEQALLNSVECNRSVGQLEQELHRAKLREEELTQDKQALEQQQLSNRLQISALQSKLDETRHCYHDNTREPTQELRDALDTAQQSLHSKEQEVELLLSQLDNVQRDLSIKEVELKHLTLQLERLTNENAAHVHELQEQIEALKENVSTLTILVEEKEAQRKVEDQVEESLPSALLKEKNHEIDHLNSEIQRLEQELENTRDNKELESDLHDLSSQVEHLQSEISRLRQDKREEEERLHEVISTLQAELSMLGANVHEVSDSQDGDSINPSPAPSPEPRHFALQEPERRGKPNSLKQELNLTSSQSLRSRLKALQSQLETMAAEKESLEHLLHTQEEEYRGHGEEFGRRLSAERGKADELKVLLALKEAELVELKAQLEEAREELKVSEDERNDFRLQAQQVQEERVHLSALVTELQAKEQNMVKEVEDLKTKEQDIKNEMMALRESSLTLEAQVQRLQADISDREEGVAKERARMETLVTVKAELSAEHEALRRREGQLQEEVEKLRQEVASLLGHIEDLTARLQERESSREDAQKEVLTHAEETLAKTDAALRLRETELARLGVEHQALRAELTAVKQCLSTSTQRAEKLLEEGQSKDRALANLENDNHLLKVELLRLQEDLALQEETLAHQQRQLPQIRQHSLQIDTLTHHKGCSPRDISQRTFEEAVSSYRDNTLLSSPEVLRRLEHSEDLIQEQFHASVLCSHVSELSALTTTDLDHLRANKSPVVTMEPPLSRTITPDPATQSTHSPRSLSVSDNFSMVDSVSADNVCDLEELDVTEPPSPLGSTSSLSAPEWASDGYGSNVSSDLGARLRVELDQTERLDAQFVEYLRCRGMNPTANTDSAAGSMSYSDDLLSPELQALLRKVYQESCRILTLSQRRAPLYVQELNAISQLHEDEGPTLLNQGDKSSSEPPMSWQQEKRALQETVIALRELLCRMAQRRTNTASRSDGDREQLQTESQTRAQLLEDSQKQLKCAHETQQEQKNKILSLRLTIEECEEALRKEQTRVQDLQQQLEQERAICVRQEREVEQKLEVMRTSSEQQRSELMALNGQVEQERVACSNLRRELQIEQSRSVLLEKRLDDSQKELEDERQHSTDQHELHMQEKTHFERMLTESESRLFDVRSKLADAHRMLDEERDRCTKQLAISRRHEEDAAREGKFISDLRSQLEQERRQKEELAGVVEKLKVELLQSRRQWEQDKSREEIYREEAATRHRLAVEALTEQKEEVGRALESERERSRRQAAELAELKNKERQKEEAWERERRKGWQEQMERDRRQERTTNKLHDLELLRQQDKQRLDELQRTLTELQREEKEMAAQRMSGLSGERHQTDQTDVANVGGSQQSQQSPSIASSRLLERTVSENSELTQRVTLLSQERTALKHKLSYMERQLRRAENELLNVATERENIPISDMAHHNKVQRLYERYLRAESFRKALVYQKRYLLLLLGGFQDCEQATLCLIANMGARPSPFPLFRRPLGRFRAAVRVVIAISRMKFLTRKFQKAIRRLSVCGTVNGHASGLKADVVCQQQQSRLNSESPPNRDTVSALVPPSKSPFRVCNRSYSSSTLTLGAVSQDPERSLTEYIQNLEKVQQRLVGSKQGSSFPQDHKKSDH